MGIFSKKPKPAPVAAEQVVTKTEHMNLTVKNVKVEVSDDTEGLYVPGVYIWEDDKLIRGLNGNEVLFEVGPRSKAFGQLQKYARSNVKHIQLRKREGEYGPYYDLAIAVETTHDEAFGK